MSEAEAAGAAPTPVTVAYYYRAKWGHHEEFIELFLRNHWPILRIQRDEGRYLDVRAHTPRFHGDGRADWTFLVTITYRDWDAIQHHTPKELTDRLYPDQGRFLAEEARRFEILDAHWDVALAERALPEAQ